MDSSSEDNLSVGEVTEDILKLDKVLQTAITNSNKKQSKQNKKSKGKAASNFHVGMKVRTLNMRSQQRKGGKLDPNYLGPTAAIPVPSRGCNVHELLLACQSPQGSILSTHLKFQTDRTA